MNDFIAKLIALRNGAGNIVKGTVDNIANAGDRYDAVRQHELTKNNDILNDKFGGAQGYEQFLNEQSPLPETPGQQLGDFLQRLIHLRGGQ